MINKEGPNKPFYASKYSVNPNKEQVINKFESNFPKPEIPNSGKEQPLPTNNGEAGESKKTEAEHAIMNKVKEYRKILEKIVDTQPLTSRIESKLTQRQGKDRQGENLYKVKNNFSAESLSDTLDGDMRGFGEWMDHIGTYSENARHEGLGTVQNVKENEERWVVEKEVEGHRGEIEDTKNKGRLGHRRVQESGKEAKDETTKWKNIDDGRIERNYEGEHRIAGRYKGMMEGIIEGQSGGETRIDGVNKGEIRLVGGMIEKMKGQDERENVGQRRIPVGHQWIKEGMENIRNGENREVIREKEEQNRIHEGRKHGIGRTDRVKQDERRIKYQGIEREIQEQHRIQRVKDKKEGIHEVTNEGERKILLGQNGIGIGKLEENEGIAGVLKNIDNLGEKGSGDGIMKDKVGERRIFGVHGEIQGEIREREKVGSKGIERERQGKFRTAAIMGQIKQRLREQEKMRHEGIMGSTWRGKAVQIGTNDQLMAEGRNAEKRIEGVKKGQQMIRMKLEEEKERMGEKIEEYRKRAEKENEQMGMESAVKERKTGWDRLLGEEKERKHEY